MNVNAQLQNVSVSRNPNRRYRVGTVSSLEDVPAILQSCSLHFVLLLALDATSVGDDRLRAIARILLDRGLASLVAWGPACSRVHDQFDLERDPNETDDQVVTTSWHDDEPLSEAVWYFDFCAYPSADFEGSCTDWVAISVANEGWEKEFRRALTEPQTDEV